VAEYHEKKEAVEGKNVGYTAELEKHKKEMDRRHHMHMLENERVRLNDTIGKNKYLKDEIDIMRKEICFAKDSIAKMSKQIASLKKTVTESATDSIIGNRISDETNNQILALKAKHEEEKERFELQIKQLQERLKERDDPIEFDDKSFNHHVNDSKGTPGQKQEAFANPIVILKLRVNKLNAINKKKKKLVD
jgi:hypothetical protein